MANKMIIDASHPEETRVVVLRGNRVEEFDFEAASKKPLRGNIYLAKVTRVEPSLQAAFVEYGGNRHGFLAFSEIHPDYYQIPVADRQALLEDEARQQRDEEEEESRPQRRSRRRRNGERSQSRNRNQDERVSEAAPAPVTDEAGSDGESNTRIDESEAGSSEHFTAPDRDSSFAESSESASEATNETSEAPAPTVLSESYQTEADSAVAAPAPEAPIELAPIAAAPEAEAAPVATKSSETASEEADEAPEAGEDRGNVEEIHEDEESDEESESGDDEEDDDEGEQPDEEQVEQVGGDDIEEMPARAHRPRRQYKIQEVIKRRQVLLVQVVKEERGNKGAALTTYLSLAGRYSVLMPNTARGGGISRKITDVTDRKRLKGLVQELEVPEGMGVILRTAGASRTKQEIKRDFEYLLRMWETVRELTLRSTAPTLVYEEGSLIKRSIRDLYNKDIDDINVAGEDAFREARDFMRLLMPSHVKNVVPWREPQPIFARFGVEAQLDSMFSNQVTLRSGGYIVINQTEALVAIDVNSGRSTREHNIEDTALRTNLEAADEVARQLRLRDLAGLIVVDFIDMEENRNNRAVERRMKDALKNDRARIQVGRISHFGLLEMSRQRMRTGVLEGSTVPCPHCLGSGLVRSTSSIALHVLRILEDALIRSATHNMTIRTRAEVAFYILNQKRSHLREIERRFGVTILVLADPTLTGAVFHALERGDLASPPVEFDHKSEVVRVDTIDPSEFEIEEEEEEETEDEAEAEASAESEPAESDEETSGETAAERAENDRRRRRRRRRRGRGDRESSGIDPQAPQPSDAGLAVVAEIGGDIPMIPPELATVSDGEVDEFDVEADAAALESGETEQDRNDRNRRRRRRGRGRGRREFGPQEGAESTESPRDGFWAQSPTDAEPVDAQSEAVEWPTEAAAKSDLREPPVVEAQAPEPMQAAPAEVAPAPVAAAPTPVEPEPSKANDPIPARLIEEPEAPPPPVKRGGWWQRAKATFGS